MKQRLILIFTIICMAICPVSVMAADKTYSFTGTKIAMPCQTEDVTAAELTKDISVTTSGDLNWKTAAVTNIKNNKDCGYYPIGDSFKAKGSYIFLATGSTNNNSIFTLNLPEIEAGAKVTITYTKPVITNNGSTRRNENDPYAYFKIADRYITINGGDFDKWQTKSVTIGEATDTIEFHCDKWGAVAIEKIEISQGNRSLKSLTVQSAQYANLTVNGIKFYANENGKLDAGMFEIGEVVTITAQKDGYKTAEETVIIREQDYVPKVMPECEKTAVYYESDFGNAQGKLQFSEENSRFYVNTPVENTTKLFGETTFGEGASLTIYAENDTPIVSISRREDGIYAGGEFITSKDNMQFELVLNQSENTAHLVQNNEAVKINHGDLTSFKELSFVLSMGGVTMDYIGVSYPDKAGITIEGPDTVSSAAEHIYYKYKVIPEDVVPDAVTSAAISGNAKIFYDNAVATMIEVAPNTEGKATLSAEYNGIKAEKEITIVKNPKIIEYKPYENAMNLNTSQCLLLKHAFDEYGNDIGERVIFKDCKSSDESVIKVTSDGLMTAVGTGKATITANAYTGTDNMISAEYEVGNLEIWGRADIGETVYEPNIFDDEHITGYKIGIYADGDGDKTEYAEETDIPAVSIDKDGFLITTKYLYGEISSVEKKTVYKGDKTVVSTAARSVYFYADGKFKKITADDINTTMRGFEIKAVDNDTFDTVYHITPVYAFANIGDVSGEGKTLDSLFAAERRYDITFKKAETWRGDIYVNGAMVGNNVDQADADRKLKEGALYTAENVKVDNGKITVSMTDGSTKLDYVTVEQSAIQYEPRIFIIGDSLACEYYGDFEQEVGGGRSGWGQQLGKYVNLPITNLANSGQYAAGLYKTAFPGVIRNANSGDILLIECAYNDRNYSTREEMTSCVKAMITECRLHGILPILITPNASKHDYKESVAWSSYLKDIAVDMECQLIDLSKLSYDFLYSLYGDDEDNVVTMNYNLTAVGGDTLHSSYAASNVWAAMIATELKKMGFDWITTDYKYTFTDTVGNTITAEIK